MGACCSSAEKERKSNDDKVNMKKADESNHILGMDDDNEEKQLDPKDFMAKKLKGQYIVKGPGELKGQNFTVDNCKDCNFFLCDMSAAIQIDDCTNCVFFIGPCESSVFVRNCTNCKMVVACRQFRTRECQKLDVMLFCAAGQPIIELSKDIRFAAFRYSYFQLPDQFRRAEMNVWDTEWSNIYDFTKNSSTGDDREKKEDKENWGYLPIETTAKHLLGKDAFEVVDSIKEEEAKLDCPVPPAWGLRPLPKVNADGKQIDWEWERCFVMTSFDNEGVLDSIRSIISDASTGILMRRSRARELSEADIRNTLSSFKSSAVSMKRKPGLYIGIELVGRKCIERTLEKFGNEVDVSKTEGDAAKAAVAFFDALAAM